MRAPLLFYQLIALQRKNLLVTRRGFLWCCCQYTCAIVLVFLCIILFFFLENPFKDVASKTWEASESTQRLTPVTLQTRSVFPTACFPFGLEGYKYMNDDLIGEEGQGDNYTKMSKDGDEMFATNTKKWRAVEPYTTFFDEELKPNFRRGYELLQIGQLFMIYKMAAASTKGVSPRNTIGLIGASSKKLADKLIAMDSARTTLHKPLYDLFHACDITTKDCKDMFKCFFSRVDVVAKMFYGEAKMLSTNHSCSSACYNDRIDTRWASSWSTFAPLATKVLEVAIGNADMFVRAAGAAMPGCKSTGTSANANMAANLDPKTYAPLLMNQINLGSQCKARPTGGRRLNDFGSRTQEAGVKSSAVGSAMASPPRKVIPAIVQRLAESGPLEALFGPDGLLQDEILPRFGAEASVRRLQASHKARGLSEDNSSDTTVGRRLKADCEGFGTACECATEPLDCGWVFANQKCGKNNRRQKAVTSCWECATQSGCSTAEIDTRARQIMAVLVPSVRTFADTTALDDHVTGELYGQVKNDAQGTPQTDAVCAAIILEKADCLTSDSGDCSYVLRLNTSLRRDLTDKTGRKEDLRGGGYDSFGFDMNDGASGWSMYFQGGFMSLQYAVDDFLLNPSEPLNSDPPGAYLTFVPMPRSVGTAWDTMALRAFAGRGEKTDYGLLGFLSFSIIVIAFAVVSRALREKEDMLRDGMRMMGLSNVAYYLSHYIWAVTWALFPTAAMTILLQITPAKMCTYGPDVCTLEIGGLFRNTNFFWIFMLFFLGVMANVSLGMLLVPLVGRARTGRVLAPAMMYFLQYVNFTDPSTHYENMMAGLCPNIAVLNGIRTWIKLEDIGIGLTTASLSVPVGDYAFGSSILMLIIDTVAYFVLYWYFDQVAPYGSAHRSVVFFLTKSYWQEILGGVVKKEQDSLLEEGAATAPIGGAFEAPSAACLQMMQEGRTLEVRGLQKHFVAQGQTIAAVDGVDFSFYPGEIYVLLGHNGAGKSTSINCLTGLIRSTAGTARLFGQSLWSLLQTTDGRKQIGICPQHNVLWRELTCLEHTALFGNFRGLKHSEAKASGVEILQDCGLSQNMHKRSSNLSGGMKRKLCLAIAFVGDPQLCFLDEPSSGMDPTARRDTWDLLRRKKEGRIVVLTTHYMDEADVLGDRIGIMAHGQLQCLGSSIFLKQHYGCGYNLILEVSDDVKKKVVSDLILRELGENMAKVASEAGSELIVLVDFAASRMFPKLFAVLDSQEGKTSLGVRHWSIAVCHLEEVFLRVASGTATDTSKQAEEVTAGVLPPAAAPSAALVGNPGAATQADGDVDAELNPRACRQLAVMMQKRTRYMLRDPTLLFCQLLCPCVALSVIILIMNGFFSVSDRLDLSLEMFNDDAADNGAPRHVVPHAALTASMATMAGSTVAMGLADQSPKLSLSPKSECVLGMSRRLQTTPKQMDPNATASQKKMEPQFDMWGMDSTGRWGSTCTPEGAAGTSSLLDYTRSFSCQLLGTIGAQEASRYVGVFPVASDASGNSNMVIFGNLTGIHIAPVAANVASNLIRKKAGKTGKVKVATHPLPTTKAEKDSFFGGEGLITTLALMLPTFVFPFPIAFAAAYVIREKETGVKSQHLMSGVSVSTYWFACIFADILIFVISVALALIPCALSGLDAILTGEVILAFLLFGLAQVPFSYLIGSCCNTAASAQNFVLAFNMGVTFIFGTAGMIVRSLNICWEPEIVVMPSAEIGCTLSFSDWLDPIIRFVPGVCLSEALHVISMTRTLLDLQVRNAEWYVTCERELALYQRNHWACAESPLSFGAAGGPLLWLGIEAFVFILILFLNDWSQLHPTPRRALQYFAPAAPKPEGWEDEDVLAEAARMGSPKEVAVHMKGMTKVYGPTVLTRLMSYLQCCVKCCCTCCCEDFCKCFKCTRPVEVHAVKGVDFEMAYGEVFGLLGTNGAGKSTIFNMIAGYLSPCEGTLHVAGLDMNTGNGSRAARKRTGYCPQDNALLEMMTPKEHLLFYSNLKGLPSNQVTSVAEAKLQHFGLKSYENNYAANLSGGNKRKLMAALALIGDPPIILVDEPSAGMDPVARRFMWGMIKNVASRRKRSSVLLSTHSMEECEALCSRSAIMVNGVFRCLGTNAAICARYGGAFDLMIKVQRPSEEEMKGLTQALNLTEDHRLDLNWATQTIAAQDNEFLATALKGRGSPFSDPRAKIAPSVFVEWWIFAQRFHALHAFAPKVADKVELVEWHSPMARYKLTTQNSLSGLFALIEGNKKALKVLEYSISATTLEQIFNNFARHQELSKEDGGSMAPEDAKVASFAAEDLQSYVDIAVRAPLPADAGQITMEPGLVSLGEPLAGDTPRTGVESLGPDPPPQFTGDPPQEANRQTTDQSLPNEVAIPPMNL